MSKDMELFLSNLTSEEDVLLGIHRVGSIASKEKILDILKNGLKMTGHLNGAVNSEVELKNNIGYYASNKTIIKELMYANVYKESKGSILVRIPDRDLLGQIFITDRDGNVRLDPKYILGYVPVDANHHIERLVILSELEMANQTLSEEDEIVLDSLTNASNLNLNDLSKIMR